MLVKNTTIMAAAGIYAGAGSIDYLSLLPVMQIRPSS
jgi:hypothetical protein